MTLNPDNTKRIRNRSIKFTNTFYNEHKWLDIFIVYSSFVHFNRQLKTE